MWLYWRGWGKKPLYRLADRTLSATEVLANGNSRSIHRHQGRAPNPKLCIDFKHELTSPFIGWMAEEFQAFEAMCLEKVGFDDLERFDESR
jgi:hypothetical protein